ncbi:putative gustatory receptor 28b isoform X2 [Ooceraea biroi]|uniref:putative gustatory receptor 28b isoform X2 n=1 Tax=Ooceraea biroi TaxID=2015173 RepID=UPI000F07A24F|nr:putative gustatory receptor 28b isoform X2 [Ooceraea biroi]
MNLKKNQLLVFTGQSLEKISYPLGINWSSRIGRLYSFIVVVLFSVLSQMSWYNVCIGHCEEHLVRKVMIILQYILHFLLVLMMVGTSLFRPKPFAFPYQEVYTIDSILESYGARISKKDIFLLQYLQDAVTATVALLVAMKYIYDIILNNSFQLIYFSLRSWYTIVCWLIMDGIFAHCVNDIYLRLRELNKIAIQYSKEKLSVSSVDFTTNSNAFNKHNDVVVIGIRLIQHIHHGLYVLSTKVNKNFSIQLLIASAICLNGTILLLHDIYYNIKADRNNTETLIFNINFIFCYILRTLYISYVCQRAKNEFRKMAIILHDAFLEHRLLRAEVIHFSLQLVHEDLTFSAFGLYDINIPHFCSIFV